jgi:hypothetical protein
MVPSGQACRLAAVNPFKIGSFPGPDFRRNCPAKVIACLGRPCIKVVAVPTSQRRAF